MLASVAKLALVGATALSLVEGQAIMQNPPKFQYGSPNSNALGVRPTGSNGKTNPSKASLNTPINQTSSSRLASINSVDDWCTFGPEPTPNNQTMGYLEAETVAYCTKARNNARVIPDGTVTAVHFVKTPLYVQVMALGDFTKINMAPGDAGGELDPHGATNMGNPVGGNVTSNVVDGKTDVSYQEWMNYISYNQMCFRVCIAGTDVAPTPLECQHELDEMGCNWVMPGDYSDNVFDSCEADAAYPPGIFVLDNGSTSTFHQYFTGVYTDGAGNVVSYTNGSPDQSTPQVAFSMPSSSNCVKHSSISNGLRNLAYSGVAGASSSAASGSGSSASGMTASRTSSGAAAGQTGSSGSQSAAGSQQSTGSTKSAASTSFSASPLFAALVAAAGLLVGVVVV